MFRFWLQHFKESDAGGRLFFFFFVGRIASLVIAYTVYNIYSLMRMLYIKQSHLRQVDLYQNRYPIVQIDIHE